MSNRWYRITPPSNVGKDSHYSQLADFEKEQLQKTGYKLEPATIWTEHDWSKKFDEIYAKGRNDALDGIKVQNPELYELLEAKGANRLILTREDYHKSISKAIAEGRQSGLDTIKAQGWLNDIQIKALSEVLDYHRKFNAFGQHRKILAPLLRGIAYKDTPSASNSMEWSDKENRLVNKPVTPFGTYPADHGQPSSVHHPKHYNNHPSGIECIDVVRWFNFNLGNAIKYIWRSGEKGSVIENLEKAIWYLQDEIQRMKNSSTSNPPTTVQESSSLLQREES